jgi:hypothetical protein
MKKIYILIYFVFSSIVIRAQVPVTDSVVKTHATDTVVTNATIDTIVPANGNVKQQLKVIKNEKKQQLSDTTGSQPASAPLIDSSKYNKYGDLKNDDPQYNKRKSVWKPALQVIGENTLLSLVDSRVLHLQFSKVSLKTWNKNLHAGLPWGPGWEWDQDRFGNNFLSHPMMGNFYFNAARANGYNFWQSTPFVLAGSYMWKIFGENGIPEREDLINTTFDGILLGEILYRVSSDILDDRTRGTERFFRELLAGIIDPVRGFNRFIQGKMFTKTNKEVYQQEPMNITLYGGDHIINSSTNNYLTGKTSEMFNAQLDYGNPFEITYRKPYDLFRLRAEMNFGIGRKIVDNIQGYGILFGKNAQLGKLSLLVGGLQYYDYFDNNDFELSTIAFGAGLFTNLSISKSINFYNNFHLAVVPFGGSSVGPVTDTSQFRDYRFVDGFEGKIESELVLGKYATVSLEYDYYFINAFDNTGKDESYYGTLGINSINILRPQVTVRLVKDLSIGAERDFYLNHHYQASYPSLYSVQAEQRIFLMLYFEAAQRKGHYN